MEDEVEVEPKIEQVEFAGKLTGTFEEIKGKLSQLQFYSLQEGEGKLDIVRVENVDIHKKPFLFYIMTVKPDALVVTYSIIPGSSDRLRRAVIIKSLVSVLSIMADSFHVDEGKGISGTSIQWSTTS